MRLTRGWAAALGLATIVLVLLATGCQVGQPDDGQPLTITGLMPRPTPPVGPALLISPVPAREDCGGRTLQALVDATPAGGTVMLPACVYRETVRLVRPITIDGGGRAEVRGSDVWSDWSRTGQGWVSARSVPPLGSDRHIECARDQCHWPEQVFVDGQAVQQVAAGGRPGSGQFALDTGRHVVLGDDPSGHGVEVTVRTRWFDVQSDGVTLQRLIMHHAANDAQTGGVGNQSRSDFSLQDSVLSDAHGAVVSLGGGSNVRLLRNDISRGGQEGVNGYKNSDTLVQANRIHNNNTEGFNAEWEAGGLKFAAFSNATLDGNEVYANDGPGLWCDLACHGITFTNNRVHDNTGPGIFFEISDGAEVANNSVWNTGQAWSGILISSSANAHVHDNVLAWNPVGIAVWSIDRADKVPIGTIGNQVFSNTILMRNTDGAPIDWTQHGAGRLFDDNAQNGGWSNRYWAPGNATDNLRFIWQNKRLKLNDFNGTPGGKDGQIVSAADRDQALNARSVPGPT